MLHGVVGDVAISVSPSAQTIKGCCKVAQIQQSFQLSSSRLSDIDLQSKA